MSLCLELLETCQRDNLESHVLTSTSYTPGIRVISCGAEKCVSWPGRPLGGTENFGVSPALPIGRELKRLCKPLQKVFVLDAHAIAKLAGQPPAQRSTTRNSQRFPGARAWSETCWPQCAPRSEPSGRPGEGAGAAVGRRDATATGSPCCRHGLRLPVGSRA